ncbi:MAG: hypothetical protein JWQ09_5832 [Segetibacter sp.]|nr:hypothetical protein [Segetibacter sp.]
MNPPLIQNIHKLEWNSTNDCVFEATITNNFVTDIHFCEPPAKVGDEQTCLRSTNEPYLRQLAANLNELFAYIDKERSKVASFSNDVELKKVS